MPANRCRSVMVAVALFWSASPAHAQTGVVLGVVEDTLGKPVAGATVSLRDARLSATADDKGRFWLLAVPSRQHRLIARRLGFDSVDTTIDVRSGETLSVVITLKPVAVSLTPVQVEADGITEKLREVGFDRRRRLSTTVPARQFITRAEIEQRNPALLSTMVSRAIGANACTNPTMFIDGTLRAPPPQDAPVTIVNGRQARQVGSPPPRTSPVDEIPPSHVEGIEIYRGGAQIPVEYKAAGRGSGCVMLIWTR